MRKKVPPSTSSLLFLLVVMLDELMARLKASRHMKKLIRRARVKKMICEFPFDFFGILIPLSWHTSPISRKTFFTPLYMVSRSTWMMTRRANSLYQFSELQTTHSIIYIYQSCSQSTKGYRSTTFWRGQVLKELPS